MNLKKLKQAEKAFLTKYPGGFEHPEMVALGKKHNLNRLTTFIQENLSKKDFKNTTAVTDSIIKVVGRSSLVSVFEKAKFKDFIYNCSAEDLSKFTSGLKSNLHGNEKKGFEQMLSILNKGKLGKWPLLTVAKVYQDPTHNVFVKPTTAKGIITTFELEDISYNPKPSWEFYQKYKNYIEVMKTKVNKKLCPNNPAFTGFLMMSMDQL